MRRVRPGILLAVLLAVTVGACGGRGRAPAPPSAIVARVPIDDNINALALGAHDLWVMGDHALYRIDQATSRPIGSVELDPGASPPLAAAEAGGTLWVAALQPGALWRVDAGADRTAGRVTLAPQLLEPLPVAAWQQTVWVGCCGLSYGSRSQGRLFRVDARSGRVTARAAVPEGPLALVADSRGVWVATADGEVLRVDAATAQVAQRIAAPAAASRFQAMAEAGGRLWLADSGDGAVRRLDPASGRVDLAVDAPAPRTLAAGAAGVWVVVTNDRLLVRLDERGRRLEPPIPFEQLHGVRGLAVGADAVWASVDREVVRVDPRRLAPLP
ncbi:MAG TPA: hypothetical protein VKG45_09005 [Actinomycetes bacterium]|nr:hypothetical protein [Actinomycetes bacterium]